MKTILLLTLIAGALPAKAVLSVTSPSFTYAQTFDTLSTSATSTWTNNSTLSGWYLYKSDLTSTTLLNAGTGTSTTGGFWSYGATASSDRALGGLGSSNTTAFGDTDPGPGVVGPGTGVTAGYIAVGLNNSTGNGLSGITIQFAGEEWRNGGNTTAQTMALQYGFGSTFATVGAWTAPGGSFDWTSPVATATAAPVVGNTAGLVTGLGGSLSGLTWAAGDTLWIRWLEVNDSGNDHGLAIDNFSVTNVTAVPEPTSAAVLGSLALLSMLRRRR